MGRVIVKVPDAFGACHDIEVIGLVAVRYDDRMVPARHKDNIPVFDSHRLVDVARVAVDALENKPLRWVDSMVISFLKQAFRRNVIDVVFVGRIA